MRKLLAVMAMGISMPVLAEGTDVHFYAGIGYDLGGDKVEKVEFSDGSTQSVYAGAGFNFALGADVDLSEDTMARATVGMKIDSVTAENGDATLSRVPLELLGYKFWGDHGLGGGLSYHTSVGYDCDFSGVCDYSVDLDNEMGFVIEYLYRSRREDSNKGFSVGVRTGFGFDYEAEGGGGSVNGNFIGANLGITL